MQDIIKIISDSLSLSNHEIIDKLYDSCRVLRASYTLYHLGKFIIIKGLLEKKSSEVILKQIEDCIAYINQERQNSAERPNSASIGSLKHINSFIELIKPLIKTKVECNIKHIAYSMAVYDIILEYGSGIADDNTNTYNDLHQALVAIAMKDPSKIQPDNRFIDICNLMFGCTDLEFQKLCDLIFHGDNNSRLSDLASLSRVSKGTKFKLNAKTLDEESVYRKILPALMSGKLPDVIDLKPNILPYLAIYDTRFNPSLNTEDPLISEVTLGILVYLDLHIRTKRDSIVPIYFGQQTLNNMLIDILFKKLLTFEVFKPNPEFYTKIILEQIFDYIKAVTRYDYEYVKYDIAITPFLLTLDKYLERIDIHQFNMKTDDDRDLFDIFGPFKTNIQDTLRRVFKENACDSVKKVLGI